MKINVQKLYGLDGHRDCVYGLEKSATPKVFYSASGDGIVAEWNLDNPDEGNSIMQIRNSVYAIHQMPEKNLLVAGQNFEGIHLVDLATRNETGSLKLVNSQIFDIKSHKGRLLVATGAGVLFVVDLETLAIIKEVKLSDKSIRTLAINPLLGEIAAGLSDNTISILDLDDFKQKYRINAHKLSVFSLVYHLEKNLLLSASRDAHLKSWNVMDHYSLVQSVPAHMFAINSISISPDSQHFATASMDKTVKIWKMENMQLLKVIDRSRHAGHTSSVNKVIWMDNQQQVVSCSDDKKISVWKLGFA